MTTTLSGTPANRSRGNSGILRSGTVTITTSPRRAASVTVTGCRAGLLRQSFESLGTSRVSYEYLMAERAEAPSERAADVARANNANIHLRSFSVVRHFEKWHGHPAREITRKMRVPPQTDH